MLDRAPAADAATDAPSEFSPSGPYRAFKQFGLVLLCGAWVLLGLFHHDPWKPDDATTFGYVLSIVRGGDWLLPHLAGEAVVGRPPLFDMLAAATGLLFGGLIPLHDAARISVALCLGFMLWLIALTGIELYGRPFRWPPVLVLVGCVGLWDRAHQLASDVGLLAAYALALYALALCLRRERVAGLLLGIACAIAFLCKGWFPPALIAITALVLPCFPAWRTRRYALTLLIAAGVAIPLFAAWPAALYLRDPALWAGWAQQQGFRRWLQPDSDLPAREPLYYLVNLPWLAWPALPLALWSVVIRLRGFNGGLRSPGIELPATMFIVVLIALSASTEPRTAAALPLLLPLSLIGAAEVDTLKRGYSGALDWFGILTFGLLGALVWLLWIDSLQAGLPEAVAHLFRDTRPGYKSQVETFPLIAAVVLTVLWLMLVRPARRSNRRAVLNWAAGMTLVWGLYMTIWLPYLDSRRSYRFVAESLRTHMPADTCVARRKVGEAQRAMLDYFGGVRTVREGSPGSEACDALLLQAAHGEDDSPPPGFVTLWEGRRRGDDTEHFVLFRRSTAGSQP